MAEIHIKTISFNLCRAITLDLTSLRELICTEIHPNFFDVCMQSVSEKV